MTADIQAVEIKLLQKSRELIVSFATGEVFTLPCEYLRVHSPSAEVKGHGQGLPKHVVNKQAVNIITVEPVGNYAVKLVFDDGHDSGLYTWEYLYDLGKNHKVYWKRYQERSEQAI